MPGTVASSVALVGLAAEMARSVASWATTNAGKAISTCPIPAPIGQLRERLLVALGYRIRRPPRAARLWHARATRRGGLGRRQLSEEAARPLVGAVAALADPGCRPRQDEVSLRARERHVEEPPFLVNGVITLQRVPDRKAALLQHGNEDGLPLCAFGPMDRGEGDSVGLAIGLDARQALKLGKQVLHAGIGLLLGEPLHDSQQRIERRLALGGIRVIARRIRGVAKR